MSVKSYLNLPITIYQICFPLLIFPFDCRQGVSSKLPWMTLLGMWNPVLCRTVFLLNLSETSQPNKLNKQEQRGATSSRLWTDKWVRRWNKDRIIKEREIKSWYNLEKCSQTTFLTSGPLSPIPRVWIVWITKRAGRGYTITTPSSGCVSTDQQHSSSFARQTELSAPPWWPGGGWGRAKDTDGNCGTSHQLLGVPLC